MKTKLEFVRAENYVDIIEAEKPEVICAFVNTLSQVIDRSSSMMVAASADLSALRAVRVDHQPFGSVRFIKTNGRVECLAVVGKRTSATSRQVYLNYITEALESIASAMKHDGMNKIILPLISFSVCRFESQTLFDEIERIFQGMHVIIATQHDHSQRVDGRAYRELKPEKRIIAVRMNTNPYQRSYA